MVDVFNLACISNKRGPVYEMNSKSAFESEEKCLAEYSENKSLKNISSLNNLSAEYLSGNPQDIKLLYHLNHEDQIISNFRRIYPGSNLTNQYYSKFFDNGISYNDLIQQQFLALDAKGRNDLLKSTGQLLKS
jgi:hypothetical protein